MTRDEVLLQVLTELQAVHNRHHHVRDHDVGYTLTRQFQAALPVGSLQHVEARRQQRAQVAAHVGIVVHDQNVRQLVGVLLLQHA